jgi:nucleoside-diphosphate-sugar epimerase
MSLMSGMPGGCHACIAVGIPDGRFAYAPLMHDQSHTDDAARPPCVIAGCGYVGARLAARLSGKRQVTALVRRPASAGMLRELGHDARVLDFDAPAEAREWLAPLVSGAAVVYLAPPPDTGASDPRLARFLESLGAARPVVLAYMSTTGVYGDTGGATVDEDSPLAATSERALRRVAAERIAAAWCLERGVRHVVLRAPGIYGPHRLPLERLRRGEPALREEDCGPGNRIHDDDLVTACVAAIDGTASGAFNVTDGQHATTTAYLLATAELAGLPAPRLVSRAEARTQISPGMLAFLGESRRVDNRRMREVLGVRLSHPDMRSGIAASLAEERAGTG